MKREAEGGAWLVPWREKHVWQQVRRVFRQSLPEPGRNDRLRELAGRVEQCYLHLDTLLEPLCNLTCVSCRETCCRRATVWYDFCDLALWHVRKGKLPDQQIHRLPDGRCSRLGQTGCRAGRVERPFLCTWYICSEQKKVLADESGRTNGEILTFIEQLKDTRREFEHRCIRAMTE